jgi:hypothetical protein
MFSAKIRRVPQPTGGFSLAYILPHILTNSPYQSMNNANPLPMIDKGSILLSSNSINGNTELYPGIRDCAIKSGLFYLFYIGLDQLVFTYRTNPRLNAFGSSQSPITLRAINFIFHTFNDLNHSSKDVLFPSNLICLAVRLLASHQ